MTAHPTPSDFDTQTNATYDALMWALSRPGLFRSLPGSGLAQIIDALIDRECAVFCDTPDLTAHAVRAGADPVGVGAADHVFLTQPLAFNLLHDLRLGSDLHPEDGATLVAFAKFGEGHALRLTGPGVEGHVDVKIGGLPAEVWQLRAQIMRYPMGFEMFLIDGARVLGLPRSTRIEVL